MPRHVLVALAACTLLAGCDTKKGQYVGDGDTGRAAPATVRDMSETPRVGDSTDAQGQRTGRPGVSGDSTGRTNEKQTPAARRKTP